MIELIGALSLAAAAESVEIASGDPHLESGAHWTEPDEAPEPGNGLHNAPHPGGVWAALGLEADLAEAEDLELLTRPPLAQHVTPARVTHLALSALLGLTTGLTCLVQSNNKS